jgi:FkbM family methyltransferase
MAFGPRVATHLRWRLRRARLAYRSRLFTAAARWRRVVRTRDHHGNIFFVSTRDPAIGRSVFVNGSFDADKTAAILDLLASCGITVTRVLDIGANIGTTAIEMLTRLPAATAECFEPEPFNHRLLERNIAANDLNGRVRLHRIALSDTDGTLRFEISATNPGDHRVRVTDASGAFNEAERDTIMVPCRRFDDLGITVDRQTLACLDVQAHEWNVLEGARSLVGPITLELWPYGLARAGTLDALLDRLDTLGSLYDLTEGGQRTDRATLAEHATDLHPHHVRDVLVVPRS